MKLRDTKLLTLRCAMFYDNDHDAFSPIIKASALKLNRIIRQINKLIFKRNSRVIYSFL